ncbi:hypothetical protein KsCSTR_40200 [Candidatus Kuenenia stuttgartiensis]|uniref:Uncharacterized protein n=1 Tax=Kuenenia stuttgartiensis TaxID=174633 RepID=Q1Q7P5_KUEST|nr:MULTISPECIES: hypothetical protein [Kuenenia]MCF6153155.1 hypothetical protein [Candidatus Kuenenia stuttgartiensis]MCZ7622497.1 hypothetical protein [Candidatus Kuenenia sp.]QII13399.1 hypothetical protein KsCSTR_40200 [Candidatus Kuenenia stuttgartiensis]CAJ70850.1 unknown protein [Candidatus Kuenenia stuttgartiensis]SOH05581.1 hypothetical protein KSMBR1_3103 [Candidatus Kuenenia stuttgartiensis]
MDHSLHYVNKLGDDIRVFPEYSIELKGSNGQYRADFLFEKAEERLLIESKQCSDVSKRHLSDGSDQLSAYYGCIWHRKMVFFIFHRFLME